MPSEHGQQQQNRKRRRNTRSTDANFERPLRRRLPRLTCRVSDNDCQAAHHRSSLRRRGGQLNGNMNNFPDSSSRGHHSNVADAQDPNDIPGFYYDAQKKRYFRLLPGQNNCNPMTVESIRYKDALKNRIPPVKRQYSVVRLTDKLHLGTVREDSFKYKVMDHRLSKLKLVLNQNMALGDAESEQRAHDGCSFLLTHPEMSEVIGFCFDDSFEAIKLMKWKLGMKKPTNEDREGVEHVVLQKSKSAWSFSGKVTDVCLAKTEQHVDCALFCSVGCLSTSSKAVMVPLVDPLFHDPDDTEFHISFELGRSAVWSCAWSPNTQSVAFGLEGKSLVMDGFTMAQQHIHTKKQNSLAVCFSATGKELYSGTNKSTIVCSDLRESVDRHCTYSFPVAAPVTHMQLLPDHILLISGHQNQLCTIDLRARKCLQTYQGHFNEHYKIQATIDVIEDVLCSAGQDNVVRLWSLSTGKLQNEIYPSALMRSSEMAAAWFCSTPKMVSPALLVAEKNEMLVYQS